MGRQPRFDELLANLNDPDAEVRLAAIFTLGERAEGRAVKPLLVAHGRRSAQEQAAILRAFRAMGNVIFSPLHTILLRDVKPVLRADAAHILGELSNPTSIPALSRAIQDPHEMVRALVVNALNKFDDTRIFTPLVKALKDDTLTVRLEAALALGKRGDVRAVETLMRAYEHHLVHPRNMPLVFAALARIGDPRGVDVLADALLESDFPDVRAAAAVALGHIDDIRCQDVLRAALDDRDPTVREAVQAALNQKG